MSDDKIKIMVIDDQAVVRQGFVALINTVSDMVVVAEGTNGKQAIELYRQHRPDVTLMDLRMPQLSGVEAITAIRKEFRDARLIVLTTYDGDEDIYRSLQAGAQGYLLRHVLRGIGRCNSESACRVAVDTRPGGREVGRKNG